MKKNLIIFLLGFASLLGGCKKEDNPNLPDLARVPIPLITVDLTADQTISALEPLTFAGKFTVDLFFKSDVPPAKMDIMVRKNDKTVKLFKANVTTFPSTFAISGAELTSLFGTAPVLGDKFEFGADIYTKDGVKYEAFPALGQAYGSGISAIPGTSLTAVYKSVCKFKPSDYAGKFKVTVDPWADFSPNQVIDVTVVNDSTLSYLSPVSGNPVILKVNAITNGITVNSAGYGNYGDGPITVVSAGGTAKNFVSPCSFTIDLNLKYTLPTIGAAYSGEWPLRLVKL